MFSHFLFSHCAFAFLGAQLHFGDQAAEILVAGAGGDEEGEEEGIFIPHKFVIPSEARNLLFYRGFLGVEILRLRIGFTS